MKNSPIDTGSGFDSDKPVVECYSVCCEIELSCPIDAISSSIKMDDIENIYCVIWLRDVVA